MTQIVSHTCARCGGVVEPSRTTCKYCDVPLVLPEGLAALTDERVLAVLRERLAGAPSTSLYPTVPSKKLAGVHKSHPYLTPQETVLGIYDGTVMGSAVEGFYVSAKRLGFKNQTEEANFLEWSAIDPDAVYLDDDSTLVVGPARIDFIDEEDAMWGWVDAIQTLARVSRPIGAAPTGSAAPRAAGAPVPASVGWEGVASSWPAAPPVYASEHVERLPQKPYADALGCALVDVETSGQLYAVSGGDTVCLRHASNGARVLAFEAKDTVCALRFSPDGRKLAVGGLDGKVTLYEVPTGRILGTTVAMGDGVDEVVWLGGAERFAMGSQRGEVWLIDAATCQAQVEVLGADPEYNNLGGMCALPDGTRLFISVGERLGAFDTQTAQIVWRFDGALTTGGKLTVSPRGDVLAAAGHFGIALFNATTGQPGARYPLSHASGVAWTEGGGLLRAGDTSQYSWAARPRFSPTGDALAVQDPVGNLILIDATTYTPFALPRERGRAWIEDLAWFGDGNHLLLGMSDGGAAIWRARPTMLLQHVGGLT
jgi:WD40 repeat protein